MNIKEALKIARDESSPHDAFIGALEYLSMYREDSFVVDYCHILGDYVYIELDLITIYYLDMVFVA